MLLQTKKVVGGAKSADAGTSNDGLEVPRTSGISSVNRSTDDVLTPLLFDQNMAVIDSI